MATDLLERIDVAAGSRLERLVLSHHRRRLDRIGQDVLDVPAGGWAASGTPPRPGNELEALVDGATALAAIADAIASARSSVWLAGWFFSPDFRLRPEGETLRELLAETARR